jgi:hypothetical protein
MLNTRSDYMLDKIALLSREKHKGYFALAYPDVRRLIGGKNEMAMLGLFCQMSLGKNVNSIILLSCKLCLVDTPPKCSSTDCMDQSINAAEFYWLFYLFWVGIVNIVFSEEAEKFSNNTLLMNFWPRCR